MGNNAQNHTFALYAYEVCACLEKCNQSQLRQSVPCKPEGCVFEIDRETGKCLSVIGIGI